MSPVTNEAASEQSQATDSATSSGVPLRPIGWYGRLEFYFPAFDCPLEHWGVDDTGTNGVYSNPVKGVFQRGSLAQTNDAVFAGDVR